MSARDLKLLELWKWQSENCLGLATICGRCGGGSISDCPCAYARFMAMTDEAIADLEQRKLQQAEMMATLEAKYKNKK